MSSLPDNILVNADDVRARLRTVEQLVHELESQTRRLSLRLESADRGDPRGYLNSGINSGYQAVQIARQAEAELREVIRNAYATISNFEQHDRQVTATDTPVTLPTIEGVPSDLGIATSAFSLADIALLNTQVADAMDAERLAESADAMSAISTDQAVPVEAIPDTTGVGQVIDTGVMSGTPVALAAAVQPIRSIEQPSLDLEPVLVDTPYNLADAQPQALPEPVVVPTPPPPPMMPDVSVEVPEEQKSWWDNIVQFFSDIGTRLGNILNGMKKWWAENFGPLLETLSQFAQRLWALDGTAWAILIVIVVVVVLCIVFSEIAAIVLLILGVIAGIGFTIYYLTKVNDSNLSQQEKDEYLGRALMEFVMTLSVIGEFSKLIELVRLAGSIEKALEILKLAGSIEKALEILKLAGSIEKALEILKLAGSIEKALEILKLVGNVDKTLELLKGAGNIDKALELLKGAGNIDKTLDLLKGAGNVDKALELLKSAGNIDKALELLKGAGNIDKALELLKGAGNIDKALALLSKAKNIDIALQLLDKVGDADKLIQLLDKVGDADKLIQLLDKVGDADKLIQLLDKVNDPEKLLSLLKSSGMTVERLERFLVITDNDANKLSKWLKLYGNDASKLEYFFEHIFKGQINRFEDAVGFHYNGSSPYSGQARIRSIISPSSTSSKGVYEAYVEVYDPSTGNWVQKNFPSSFFPDDWSPAQVTDAIDDAFSKKTFPDPQRPSYWEGTTSQGITIGGYMDNTDGTIRTAFPIY